MAGKLNGKVAVITGGTSGIGLATAKRFVAEGAYVFVTAPTQELVDAGLAQIGNGAAVTGVAGDVTHLDDFDRLYEIVREKKGRVDIVFANAGFGELRPFGAITEEHFDKTFAVNVKGVLFTVQKALPLFPPEGGSVILNASMATTKATPAFGVYGASKAAVRAFARSWVVDLKGRGIRVNAISAGVIETPGLNSLAPSPQIAEAMKAQILAGIPMGRLGDPDEVAKVAVFLASDDSSYITGIELFVDGGMAQV